jgi:hypothetical protein
MLAANAALAAGDWSEALQLATDAIANPNPTTDQWPQEPVPERIASYAIIEAMLAHLERGEQDSVVVLLGQLESNLNRPDNPYVDAARVLVTTYKRTGDPVAACQAMAAVVQQVWAEAQFYTKYGYAQEQLRPQQVCPL